GSVSRLPSRAPQLGRPLRLVSARLRMRVAALRGVPGARARRQPGRDLDRRPQGTLRRGAHMLTKLALTAMALAAAGVVTAQEAPAQQAAAQQAAAQQTPAPQAPAHQAGASPKDPKSMSG